MSEMQRARNQYSNTNVMNTVPSPAKRRFMLQKFHCILSCGALYSNIMSDRLRKYICALSIVWLLGGLSFGDAGHSHFVGAGFNSTPSLQSHDCNDKEQHKPLDVRFHCVQSCRVLSLSLALAIDTFRPNLTVEYIESNDAQVVCLSPSLLTESKRGPPQVS